MQLHYFKSLFFSVILSITPSKIIFANLFIELTTLQDFGFSSVDEAIKNLPESMNDFNGGGFSWSIIKTKNNKKLEFDVEYFFVTNKKTNAIHLAKCHVGHGACNFFGPFSLKK